MMRRPLLLAALCLASATAQAQRAAVPFPVKLDNTGFADALARVGDSLFIAGQPTEAALRKLAAEGVTTVISVRTPPEHANRQAVPFDEPALAQSLGMRWINIPARGDSLYPYSPASVDALAKALGESKGKVLLHCTIAYRASHLYTAFLVKYRGLPLEEALKHGRAINLGQMPLEGFLGAPVTMSAPSKP
ncbi:MAG: sulfur transferase domain-containing protein [Gemmatimonadaceae bacterium]|nr:sulfur transferase domain-containing protein [Gemmatimonadaceae bacterium]